MHKTCHGVTIQLPDRPNDEVSMGFLQADCKVWESTLERETCVFCKQADCCYTCAGSISAQNALQRNLLYIMSAEVADRLKHNGALDGIEAIILAAAVAGINIESPEFMEAVETSIDAIGNNA